MTSTTKLSTFKVLIVDDVAADRLIVRDMLEELGFSEIVEANDGDVALRLLEETQFQLVVSDIKMPNLTGRELLNIIRKQPGYSMTPFVMVTGVADAVPIKAAMSPNRTAWLLKPLHFNLFKETIRNLMQRWYQLEL